MHEPAVYEKGVRDIFYGMGWESEPWPRVPVVHHKGTNANFYADMVLDEDRRWGIVILTNLDSSTSTPGACKAQHPDGLGAFYGVKRTPTCRHRRTRRPPS